MAECYLHGQSAVSGGVKSGNISLDATEYDSYVINLNCNFTPDRIIIYLSGEGSMPQSGVATIDYNVSDNYYSYRLKSNKQTYYTGGMSSTMSSDTIKITVSYNDNDKTLTLSDPKVPTGGVCIFNGGTVYKWVAWKE